MAYRYTLGPVPLMLLTNEFSRLLRDHSYEETLKVVLNNEDDTYLSAFLLNASGAPIRLEDHELYLTDTYNFISLVSQSMLTLAADLTGIPVGAQLFKTIVPQFKNFDEPWEKYLDKDCFVKFTEQYESGEQRLPLHKTLATQVALARGAEELPQLQSEKVTMEWVMGAVLEELLEQTLILP